MSASNASRHFETHEELRRGLEVRQREVGVAALARELGVSRQMVHAVLKGAPIGGAIPRALGYEPMTVYVRSKEG